MFLWICVWIFSLSLCPSRPKECGILLSAPTTKITVCASLLCCPNSGNIWVFSVFLHPCLRFLIFQGFEGGKKKKKVEINRNLPVSVLDIILFSSCAGLAAGGCLEMSLEVLGQTRGGTATQQIKVGFLELISFPTYCCVRKAEGKKLNIWRRLCAVSHSHSLLLEQFHSNFGV